MYTLLDSCLDRIDIFEFLKHVEEGLNDHYDIKMLTYLMLVRLAHLCPSAVLQRKTLFLSQRLCNQHYYNVKASFYPNASNLSYVRPPGTSLPQRRIAT